MSRISAQLVILACLAGALPNARGQGRPRTLVLETASIVIAPSKSGRTLHGYSTQTGKWESITVARPEDPRTPPTLGGGIGHLVIGKTVYAFSGTTGHWATQDFPEVPVPLDFGPRLGVTMGSTLYQFSAVTGTWSSVNLDDDAKD